MKTLTFLTGFSAFSLILIEDCPSLQSIWASPSCSEEFLHSLTSGPIKSAIKEGLKKKTLTFLPTYGSVTLEIWDGHYLDDELYALPVDNDLLTVGNVKKFLGTQTSKKGNDMSMLVLQSLGKKLQKLRKNSPEYQQHQQFYEEAMADKFYDLVEMALLNAGYGPL